MIESHSREVSEEKDVYEIIGFEAKLSLNHSTNYVAPEKTNLAVNRSLAITKEKVFKYKSNKERGKVR